MTKIINVRILLPLLVVVAAATIPLSTEAEEHVVGGDAGWIVPPRVSFYSTSVANITFKQNDILVFNFKTGAHNVVTLSKKNFDSCKVNESIEEFNTGPARITLNRTGEIYFACAISTHCSLGQKLSVNVTASSSSSSPAGPANASISVVAAATFSVLFMAIVINVLF